MKIQGVQLGALAAKTIRLPRPDQVIEVTVHAFPMGLEETAGTLFPEPVPPKEYAKNKQGLVLRDKDHKPVTVTDTEDPAYVKAYTRWGRMQGAFYAYHALRGDPNVTFETEGDPTTPAFFEGIHNELVAAGCSTGDVAIIVREAMDLSNLNNEKMEEARESFL